ncbi:MAG: phenylacetate-CoA oxygenase subunit PaaJ [Clostridiales bacterium]|nr:phenylacetate-CoA oxygenase subunit PaaJ [Clostridiales bacterium]
MRDVVLELLKEVKDPEIPTLNIVDLGLVEAIRFDRGRLEIDLLPTFTGCPALDIIRAEVMEKARTLPQVEEVAVRFRLSPAWSTDRITEAGRAQLKAFGIAPPQPPKAKPAEGVTCPYCGSSDAVMEAAFGPTRCRSIYYCRNCRNPFEKMKEL